MANIDERDKIMIIDDFVAKNLQLGKKGNHLLKEKSPYLLQHAFNPVNWHAWSDDAVALAKQEDKPIFLSIGYSTCHWCHVMERESFENEDIAEKLNQSFICIKVDREERPDVDKIYMTAIQMMTGSGGWPLSIWLTPGLKPFYGGTYFPPQSTHGMPGFSDIIDNIRLLWENDRYKLLTSSESLFEKLVDSTDLHVDKLSLEPVYTPLLQIGYNLAARMYDPSAGGFGRSPKFPRPALLNFLLRYYHRIREDKALNMALHTLRSMWKGGMFDHLEGGFHRYSVDDIWRVPHFEKMLYDQSQLALVYMDAYVLTKDSLYLSVAEKVLGYIKIHMTHPEGGFYSAEDADSPLDQEISHKKYEGAFYMWTKSQVYDILGSEEGEIFSGYYGISESGNTLNDPHGEFEDRNVLYVGQEEEQVAVSLGISVERLKMSIDSAHKKLIQQRHTRIRPHLDDKILTSWNGFMIAAFARGYQITQDESYLKAAQKAAQFILYHLYDPETKQLKRRYRSGEAHYDGMLEDYSFFVYGLLALYEADFDANWLKLAKDLTQEQIDLFWDSTSGGFYETHGKDHMLIMRLKESYDGAEPSGNAIAAYNLLKLAQIFDKNYFHQKAEETLKAFYSSLKSSPYAMPQMLCTVDYFLHDVRHILIVGSKEHPMTQAYLAVLRSHALYSSVILLIDSEEVKEFFGEHLDYSRYLKLDAEMPYVLICEENQCREPLTNVDLLTKVLMDKNLKIPS